MTLSMQELEDETDNPWRDGVPFHARQYWTKATSKERSESLNRLVEGSGTFFCFAVVSNPPEETLMVLKEQLEECDAYMLFSNFSDPKRGIFKAIDRVMQVGQGG